MALITQTTTKDVPNMNGETLYNEEREDSKKGESNSTKKEGEGKKGSLNRSTMRLHGTTA